MKSRRPVTKFDRLALYHVTAVTTACTKGGSVGNHSVRRTKAAKLASSSSRSHNPYGYLAVLVAVLLGVGLWFVRPQVTLSRSNTALLNVQATGLDSHLIATALSASGVEVPLSLRNGALWPAHQLTPNTVVTVSVRDIGLLGWSDTLQRRVITPADPSLVKNSVQVPLGRSLVLKFRESVSQVALWPTKTVVQVNGARHVALGPKPTKPNQGGTVTIQLRARSWEPWGQAQTISWTSVPWITAHLGQTSAPNENYATAALTVTFSTPLSHASLSLWRLSPNVPGHWHEVSNKQYQFVPSGIGFTPATNVTLMLPGGSAGPVAQNGSYLATTTTLTYQIPAGLTETMQEWLAELGYLPLTFTPSTSTPASLSNWDTAYNPVSGTFAWKYARVPVSLEDLWSPTYWSVITQGAVYSFEHQHGLTLTPTPGAPFWNALRQAVQDHDVDKTPYAYVYVSETLPERLWLYVGGKVILTTLANTGIPQTPTSIGTFPVQIRTTFQIMRGKNPDGTPYADPVHWINYFHGSDAVHGFLRAQYGFPQSLGCVEVSIPVAAKIYPHLYIGALVTVQSTGSPPIQLVPPANPNE